METAGQSHLVPGTTAKPSKPAHPLFLDTPAHMGCGEHDYGTFMSVMSSAEVPLRAMFVPSLWAVGCSGPTSGVAVTPEADKKAPRRAQLLYQPSSSSLGSSPASTGEWQTQTGAGLHLPKAAWFPVHSEESSQKHPAREAEAAPPPLPGKACFLQVKT